MTSDKVDVEGVPVRSGTTSAWAAAGAPVLSRGELGVDLTTHELRIGDGSTAFADLPLAGGGGAGGARVYTAARVYYNDAGFPDGDPGRPVGITLPAGTVILAAWLEGAIGFDTPEGFLTINVVLTGGDPANDYTGLVTYDISGGQSNGTTWTGNAITSDPIWNAIPSTIKVEMDVYVSGYWPTMPPAAGAVDLYLVVIEP